MKQKDLVLIIVIVFISGVFSLILSNMFITSPKNRQTKVEIVTPIGSEFQRPSREDKNFNSTAINLTQTIRIGTERNTQIFKED